MIASDSAPALRPWRSRGACVGMPADTFFPVGERGAGGARAAAAAKTICRTCDVIADCLDAALAVPDTDGIWAGLTSIERRGLVRVGPVSR